MPRDYANRTRQRSPSKRSWRRKKTKRRARRSPLRIILLLIFFIALIIFSVFLLNGKTLRFSLATQHSSGVTVKEAKLAKDKQVKKEDQPEVQEIKFDFYKMLPKMSVEIVNDQSASTPLAPKKNSYYILQLASFNDGIGALTYRNKLKEEGFHTKISSVTRGDTTWYRVQIGPIHGESKAQKISKQLQRKNINSVLLLVNR